MGVAARLTLAGALAVMVAGNGKPYPVARFQQAWATVGEDGRPASGSFLLGTEPYAPGCGPGMGERVYGLKTARGEPIDMLALVGWRNRDAYRIVLYALLAGEPDREADPACGDSRRRREIASARLRAGQQAVLEDMKTIGVRRPWRVGVVLR